MARNTCQLACIFHTIIKSSYKNCNNEQKQFGNQWLPNWNELIKIVTLSVTKSNLGGKLPELLDINHTHIMEHRSLGILACN